MERNNISVRIDVLLLTLNAEEDVLREICAGVEGEWYDDM